MRVSISVAIPALIFGLLIPVLTATSVQSETASDSCSSPIPVTYEPDVLRNPCHVEMKQVAPESFSMEFTTNHKGSFRCNCERQRAPVHVDRIWNLARFGYFSDNYFFRVLPNFVAQFGTSGHPSVSNIYNYTTTTRSQCAILQPQPPFMPYCLGNKEKEKGRLAWSARPKQALYQSLLSPWTKRRRHDCTNVTSLSNTFGTLSMSTSYNQNISEFPDGVTWNATAEVFINLGDNSRLDKHLFIPICTIDKMDSVLKFRSFGEVSELGGPGPSLGKLYEEGNAYIESNETWASSMEKVESVRLCGDNV
eukprot:scaffold437_cov111-Cylindrotheca_fusiformis.AAC.13